MADLNGLATEVVLIVQKALGPLLERLAASEQSNRDLQARVLELAGFRDRLVAVETKAAVPPAAAVEPVDLSPVLERLAGAEARIAVLGDVRDRVVSIETKSLQPVSVPVDPAIAEMRDRILVLETKAAAPAPPVDPQEFERWLASLDRREVAPAVPASDVADIRDRVVALENRAAGPSLTDMALVDVRKAVSDLQAESSSMRERVAVVEVRAQIPGPAGQPGKDGTTGKDGVDGLGFDDLTVVQDGERSFTVKAFKGDRAKDIGTLTFPVEIYRGVYQDGKGYERGDRVTWAGSEWHANESTSTKPGDGSKAWTLTVKRGRDGKDGRDAPSLPVVSVGAR